MRDDNPSLFVQNGILPNGEGLDMSLTLSFPDLSESEANDVIGSLSESLQFEGVPGPERQKRRDDTLDAGSLLLIATPLLHVCFQPPLSC